MKTQNWNVYRMGTMPGIPCGLTFLNTRLARGPEEAAKAEAHEPGKYVVTDLNFTEIHRVDLNLAVV